MPRTQKSSKVANRHDPLHVQLAQDEQDSGPLSRPGKRKQKRARGAEENDEVRPSGQQALWHTDR